MITTGTCDSFFVECLDGIHQPEDVYKIALYGADADLGPETKRYTTAGEVKAKGYDAGGLVLTGRTVGPADGGGAMMNFTPPVWPDSTISANGAVVYNASKGNRSLMVADFGEEIRSTNHEFVAQSPAGAWVTLQNRKP